MLRGIYNVANAMDTASRNHDIVSENLVHATTPGYRRQGLIHDASASRSAPRPADAADPETPAEPSAFLYLEPGALQQTNLPLDLALMGNAFFVFEGPSGPLYTRNGCFEQGPRGELRTRGGGYAVSGQGTALRLPVDAASVTVGADGTISADGVAVGRLRLATFARPEALRRVGPTLFEGDSPQAPPPGSVKIEQGYREGSNVQPVQEMVSMILGMRFYEAASKAMAALSEAVSHTTKPQPS